MTQWRGWRDPSLPPPPPKNWGLTPIYEVVPYDSPAFSRADLVVRGWTDALIRKYLGDHDRRDSVDHWANFTGRDMYWAVRVDMAEAMPDFDADFLISAKRRRLSADVVAQMRENRLPASQQPRPAE